MDAKTRAFRNPHDPPEVQLWRAVVLQTVQDAMSCGGDGRAGRRARREAARARAYMATSTEWPEVCARAGWRAEYVVRLVSELVRGERRPFHGEPVAEEEE